MSELQFSGAALNERSKKKISKQKITEDNSNGQKFGLLEHYI